MTPDLQREFQLLSQKARQQLKNVPVSGGYRHVFSLWIMPAFSPSSRITVYLPSASAIGKPFASYSIWRSDLDLEKLRSPIERLKHPKDLVPSIQEDVLWLTDVEIEAIEQRIRGISIPPYLGRCAIAGCDGTSFEFRYDEPFCGMALHWWESHPIEWRPFTEVVMRIANELEERRKKTVQSGVAPNCGPATPLGNSAVATGARHLS